MINWLKKRFESSIPDHELVAKAQNGDHEAFGELYQKYLDRIYRYIYFRVQNNPHDAEDIAGEVFFKAWEKLNTYKDNRIGFQAWIYTIAHNAVIDYYKRTKKITRLDERVADTGQNVEDEVLQKNQLEYVLNALSMLTDEQKQVVTLRFVEGFDHNEIAEIMHKKEDAVRALQYRALKILKNKLT